MINSTTRVLITAMLALAPLAAHAAPIVISDQMDSAATYHGGDYSSYSGANFSDRSAGGKHWGDEITGADYRFDTTQATVDRNDGTNTLTITLHTMFNGNDLGAHYADLFIDTANPSAPGTYNYGIALGSQTLAAGLYTLGSVSTANDLWSGTNDIYGGYSQLKTTAPGYDPNMALDVPTRIDTGTAVAGYSVSVNRTDAGGGFYDLSIALTGDLSPFDDFDLFWGTGDCGNDTFWGQAVTREAPVDAPNSLLLFPLGLAGLMVLRRGNRQARI